MQAVSLRSPGGAIEMTVLPEYGGMVSSLRVGGRETLRQYDDLLGQLDTLSGGIPVLFPFPSAHVDNRIEIDGVAYEMRMHGFAKNKPFELVSADDTSCTVSLRSDEAVRARSYPYDFRLTIRYEVDDGGLNTTATVENLSEVAMPYALGYHPYFLTTNPARCTLTGNISKFDNYLQDGAPGELDRAVDVSEDWDHVFYADEAIRSTYVNPVEGYQAVVEGDATYNVMVLCTTQDKAVCVEPWQAKPHAQEDGTARMLAPGARETSRYRIALQTC